jgi:hypothetical protein
LKGRIVPKKTTKVASKKSAPVKPAAKAETPEPAAQASAPKPKPPVVPPKPIPPHQQFLSKGVKPQAMMKARIIRHQGR